LTVGVGLRRKKHHLCSLGNSGSAQCDCCAVVKGGREAKAAGAASEEGLLDFKIIL